MKIPFSPPDISEDEIDEVVDTLRSGWITTGEKTKRFEREIASFCSAERAVCLNSATAALELSLRILGIGPGDEVITSAYTYTASASVICHVGATPILIDTAPSSYHMDEQQLEKAMNEKTKAIIPVDIAGIPCNYDRIFEIADSKKALFTPNNEWGKRIGRAAVISDSAHSFGASYHNRPIGSIADFSCFSFHAVKNLTTGEGGAVTFSGHDHLEELYQQFMLYSLHGQSKDALAKTQMGAWEYDILYPAYKCNMTDIMAAIGLAQLKRYPQMLTRRKEIISRYDDAFSDLPLMLPTHTCKEFSGSGHLYLTRLSGKSSEYRNKVIRDLAQRGISANVHYKPLPLLTAYQRLGFRIAQYPNAFSMYQNELTLPLHTRLSDMEIEYIIEQFTDIIRESNKEGF